MRALIIILTTLVAFQAGFAATIHVPGDAATIQAGIDAAMAGDTVLVAANTYSGSGNRDLSFLGKDIILLSESGSESTIIDAGGDENFPHRCMVFTDNETLSAKVIGFTFRGGYVTGSGHGLAGNGGGAICLNSSPTFENCIFTQNTSNRHGGGLYCEYDASPNLIACSFINNTAIQNGGAFASEGAASTLENCMFEGNSAAYSGALHLGSGSNIVLNGCLIYSNTAISNGAAVGLYGSSPTFQNCTLSDNSSGGGQIVCESYSYPILYNSIISFGEGNMAIDCASGAPYVFCCDIYGNSEGDYIGCLAGMDTENDNISLDPLFYEDDSTLTYTLQVYSPCLPQNNACGQLIGAKGSYYEEYTKPLAIDINFVPGSDILALSSTPDIYWSYYDTDATSQESYEIEVGTDQDWGVAEMWSSGQVVSSDTTATYAGIPFEDISIYYLRIRLNNGTQWGDWMEVSFTAHLDPYIYVPSEFATIQEAIDLAIEGDTVLVAPGTYSGDGNRDLTFLGKDIVLKSEAGPDGTIIDAGGSEINPHRCLLFLDGETSAAKVIGFTLTGGYVTGSDWGLVGNGGGAICINSSPTFEDCLFAGNTCNRHGGGLYCYEEASPHLVSCRFYDNVAYQNGGAFACEDARSTIEDCIFANNLAKYSGGLHLGSSSNSIISGCLIYSNRATMDGGGAGLYGSNPTIQNCTISDNISGGGQVLCYGTSSPIISNTIISFGSGCEAVNCQYGGALPELYCCDVYGNEGGDYVNCMAQFEGVNDNISINPMFCMSDEGDYSISSGSACTAENSACGLIGSEEIGCYTPNALNINYGPDSYGNYVDVLTPQICWHYFDSEPTTQAAFEIQVGTDDDWSVAELWDPGPNYTTDSCVTYAGLSLSEGETYYLRIRVNNGTDWGSWSQAWFIVHIPGILNVPDEYETIQAGIDAAIPGDMVKVAPGIYSGEGNRDIHFDGKGIHLFAEDGAENTIIDCGGSETEPHRAFRFASGEAPDAIVNGFKIINGFGPIERDNSTGGAIYCSDASPTIRNCIFENNIGKSNGGAISAWGSSITIANCTFSDNHAIHGSAIYFKGVPEKNRAITSDITKCLFEHNIGLSEDMSYGGAILLQYAGMTVNLIDCVLYCNEADAGGAVAIWSDAVLNVSGCTIVGNKSNPGIGGSFYAFLNAELNIENSIIAFSKLGEAVFCGEDATVSVSCTDIFGNAGGDWTKCLTGLEEDNGNFSANPRFCNVATGDLSLYSNSPCLPVNSSCEELIGVYGQGCAGYDYQVWKIKPDGSGDFSTLQEAINQAADGDTILVKGGTYTGDGNRDLDIWGKQVAFISESGALNTIIDCQGTETEPHRAFRICNGENASNVIKGFTFMNGYGVFEKDNPKGGALYISNSSPTIEDCFFKNNRTPNNGGAVSGWGTNAIFNDCSFSNNSGMHGAAVYLNGVPDIYKGNRLLNPTFNRCSFSENICTEIFPGEGTSVGGAILMQYANLHVDFDSCIFRGNSADYGAAAVCWDDATLTMNNCTVVGNSSNVSGNGAIVLSTYYNDPRFVLNNSIIAFNNDCKAVHCSGYADIAIYCSDIFGNTEGDFVGCIGGYYNVNGNLSEDPQFCNLAVNNIHIDPGSVCAPENNSCGILIGAVTEGCILCGDSNGDATVNVSDAVYILNYIFLGGPAPDPPEAADVNCDSSNNVSDVVYIINFIFNGGNSPCDPIGDGTPDC